MDIEDIIREFWRCSLKSNFEEFDWDQAFETYEPFLADNCIAHAQGTFEEFEEWYDNMYGLNSMECSIPDWAVYVTNWGCFSNVDACRALLRAKYDFMRENFENNVHGDNAILLERLRNRNSLSEPELIQLFDECIHAQHATGEILEDVDVDSLRDEMEEEWKDEQERFPTNIRQFLTAD